MGDARMVATAVSRLHDLGYGTLTVVDDTVGPHRASFAKQEAVVSLGTARSTGHRTRCVVNWPRLRKVLQLYRPSWLFISHTAVGAVAGLWAANSISSSIRTGVFLTGAPNAGLPISTTARFGYRCIGWVLSGSDYLFGDARYVARAWEPWLGGRKVNFLGRVPLGRVSNRRQVQQACEHQPVAVAVGRLTSQKRFDVCIRAIKEVRQRGIAINLLIVGDGDERERLLELIRSESASEYVRLVGFTSAASDYIRTADLYIQTSDWEPLGMSILEALYFGVRVVSTDCAGPSELLADGVGWLAPKGSVSGLSQSVVEALCAPSFDEKRVERAREYSFESGIDRLLEILRDDLILQPRTFINARK